MFFKSAFILFLNIIFFIFLINDLSAAVYRVESASEFTAMLSIAQSNSEPDTIQMVQGVYFGNFIYSSTESLCIEGGFESDSDDRVVNPENTVIDAQGQGCVFNLSATGDIHMSGITFQNGVASEQENGAGLCVNAGGGRLFLDNNAFINNAHPNFVYGSGFGYGGGVYVISADEVSLSSNLLQGNTAYMGAGIYIRGGSVTLSGNTFQDNDTSSIDLYGRGAGVRIEMLQSSEIIVADGNTFQGNTTSDGAGIYVDGTFISGSGGNCQLSNNIFQDNVSVYDGGGAKISRVPFVTIEDNLFDSNTAGVGGGIRGYEGEWTVSRNEFINNIADWSCGGGIYLWQNTHTIFADNRFESNSSKDAGSGVQLQQVKEDARVVFVNNVFCSNSVTLYEGGALGADGTGAGVIGTSDINLIVINNLLYNNIGKAGGGLYLKNIPSLTMTNNTITGNEANGSNPYFDSGGGGVFLSLKSDSSSADIYNNIIWGNTVTGQDKGKDIYLDNDPDDNGTSASVIMKHNNFDQTPDTGTFVKLPFAYDPSNLNNPDPMFFNPAENGYHLSTGSPCMDSGDNNAPEIADKDIEGRSRIIDGNLDKLLLVDMGAYEHDPYEYCGQIWYKDADDDGYSDGTANTVSCTRPAGYKAEAELIAISGDCDDELDFVHPGATDICNDIDDNCNGQIDEECPTEDTDGDGLPNGIENAGCTDAIDADTDDDGITDGIEDANQNGTVDAGETDPCNIDTDDDGIQDGTESGLTLADVGSDTDLAVFIPDADPATTTDPTKSDTDGDGISDGDEDTNHNGRVDVGETDPNPRKAMPWIPLLLLD